MKMINFNKHTASFRLNDQKIGTWLVPTFWELTKNQNVVIIPTSELIDIILGYVNNDYDEDDWNRVELADLSYPIIVSDTYGILDGCHRVVKAYLLGHTEVVCVRLNTLPAPLYEWDSWEQLDRDWDDVVGL